MSKDPAFLFYPNDYIGGTMGMTFEEKGAYMELLMLQFNRGHMTSHMIGQTVGQIWVKIQDKFIQDEKGLWFNARLDDEKSKRKAFTASRRNNLEGKNQYSKEKKAGHMTSHMENENENENVNTVTITKKELTEKLFSDQIWVEQMGITHKGKNLKQSWEECYLHHSADPTSKRFELWQWRQKLNSWLTIKKTDNGKPASKFNGLKI